MVVWTVTVLDQAAEEMGALAATERNALVHAMDKLEAVGPKLGYPHTSAVQQASGDLRELRPRAGRSRWRALYSRAGQVVVIAAVAPEAERDPRGFTRAVRRAETRLAEVKGN